MGNPGGERCRVNLSWPVGYSGVEGVEVYTVRGIGDRSTYQTWRSRLFAAVVWKVVSLWQSSRSSTAHVNA